jgi:hypothetical protein
MAVVRRRASNALRTAQEVANRRIVEGVRLSGLKG